MTIRKAFNLSRYFLTRPKWNEYAHVEIKYYFPWGNKVGGVRQRGRITMHPWVMQRDGDGERKVRYPEKDGWIEWVPPADATEKAKEFGWETYKS